MSSEQEKRGLWSKIRRLLPERQVHLRTDGRIKYFRVTTGLQMSLIILTLGAMAWTGYASYSYVQHNEIVENKDSEILNNRLAYQSLLGEVADYQQKFTSITVDLEKNHALMLSLVEKNASLQQSLQSVSQQLASTETERETIQNAREDLKRKLSDIENQLSETASRNFSLKDNLSSVEDDLQVALAERNKALFDGTRMRRKISDLENRLVSLEKNEESSVQRLTDRALTSIETMERVVELTGLEVNALLKRDKRKPEGQGGPFIPAKNDDMPAGRLKASLANLDTQLDRWESLQDIMKRIPLSAPLNSYYVTSGFGKRRDPINKRWSAHYGLDLGSTIKSKVYATAPGKVTFAGWKGKYGRLIEIDHGAGIKTRYGHLHKIYVKRGQEVKFREKIGLLGNSGRSTGAHLHYETVFNGRARNPMKFIRAGRYVFQEQ